MSSKIDLESLRRDIEVVNSKWSSAVNSGNPSAIEECLDAYSAEREHRFW